MKWGASEESPASKENWVLFVSWCHASPWPPGIVCFTQNRPGGLRLGRWAEDQQAPLYPAELAVEMQT